MTTSSEITIEHFQRPEVKETILRCCQDGEVWRALNGDKGWYISSSDGGVRLRNPDDYDKTTSQFRTLYWSLDLFEPEVQSIAEQWDEARHKPVNPIGTLRECRAYTLGVDIDAVGHNAFDNPDTTKALEEATTFLIDRLRAAGIEKSVYALCSGGGVYVLIHHALFTAKSEWSGVARESRFRHLLEMYNAFIRDTAAAFFEAHPEHVGRVVFDALNGQKRKFKTIFSIHKTVPAAVVPLDPQCIKISKEDATIPLSSEVLEQGETWYRDYDLAEKVRLQALLRPYDEAAKKKLERRKTETGSYDLFRRDAPTLPDEWCPLMQRIAGGVTAGETGRHAALGNLARHLYADGWSMEAAFRLWSPLADQAGVEYRIFDTSFGEISEARCKVINEPRAGYPASSLGGTRFAESCATCPRREAGGFPSDYAHPKTESKETTADGGEGDIPTAEELKDDPDKLLDPEVIGALWSLRRHERLRFETLLKKASIRGGQRDALVKELDKLDQRNNEAGDEGHEEDAEEIKVEAARIISDGRSFEYVYRVWQSRHLGDGRAGKTLIISTGAQSCTNTSGIHVILNGPRGCGKSDCLDKAAELLPLDYLLFGDMSPQAVYYFAEEMEAGAIIAFDDVTFNDAYASVQKRCTTRYQQGAEHRVVLERGPRTFKTKPRIAFWCTSVDRQFDEQLQDRYFAVNIEDSLDHKAEVIKFMKALDAGIDREEEWRETLICRAIIRDLKANLFEVVLPFAERIRLLSGVGERGYRILSDMVKAFCAFRYAVRERDARDRLLATEEDFEDAKALFDDAEGHGEEKYTEAEKKVLRGIIDCDFVATLDDLAAETGLSTGRLKDILNGRGRDEQKRYGLLAKCPALTVERVSETIHFNPEPGRPKSKTITRNEYRLDRNFDLSEVYNSLVHLDPKTGDVREDDVPRRRVDVVVDVHETDVLREVDVVDVVEEREIEDNIGTSGTPGVGGGDTSGEKISPLHKSPITTSNDHKEAIDTDSFDVNHYVERASGYVDHSEDNDSQYVDQPNEPMFSEEEIAEALEIAEGLKAQGHRVIFGNVEDFMEARTGEYVEPKEVWRVLKVLCFLGWVTDRDGAMSSPIGEAVS